jgi:hypothetical protein
VNYGALTQTSRTFEGVLFLEGESPEIRVLFFLYWSTSKYYYYLGWLAGWMFIVGGNDLDLKSRSTEEETEQIHQSDHHPC